MCGFRCIIHFKIYFFLMNWKGENNGDRKHIVKSYNLSLKTY